MWNQQYRERALRDLEQPWDLIVIGGGITGAAILREAAARGYRALLIEQRDFAWGSSSRSSKMVHGGLRYLKEGEVSLTRACVRERDRLLRDEAALVTEAGFVLPGRRDDRAHRWMFAAGLVVYDAICGKRAHRRISTNELLGLVPNLDREALVGGFQYHDAQTDDARLVLKQLRHATEEGAVALNYAKAEALLRTGDKVVGVAVRDVVTGKTYEATASVVINATGAWVDRMRMQVGAEKKMRPLRGSHLVFSSWRFPLSQTVAFPHPRDGRLVFASPWENVTLVGTTDVDHDRPLDEEPRISNAEAEYLMEAAHRWFPSLELQTNDVFATYSGVRPVISSGQADPSKESREHAVWEESGLLTVTGGKLTTHRLIATEALDRIAAQLPERAPLQPASVELAPVELDEPSRVIRLYGRYGADARMLVERAGVSELEPVGQTRTLWAELRYAAREEGVVRLDDLMLRRTRLGVLLPKGGAAVLPRLREICQSELGWDDGRWRFEAQRYLELVANAYGPIEGTHPPQTHAVA